MPYIKQDRRKHFEKNLLPAIRQETIANPGELNFLICKMIDAYLSKRSIKYTILNEVMGVLSGVAKEFYRRVVVPYEEKKMEENGDVFLAKD